MKETILILNGQYAPGYKGGGPIQSCMNMVENLSEYFDFRVFCADRDYKENKPYIDVKIDTWNRVGTALVYYASPQKQSFKAIDEILNKTDYDILYLNGFFSPIFTIKPLVIRWLGKLNKTKIVLTPRGDFTGGCKNKKIKKYIYIYLSKILKFYDNLIWHATSEIEREDILKKFPNAKIFVIPNLPAKYIPKIYTNKKEKGSLRLVFISRIFPKKNLKYALEILKKVKNGNVIFDIYGPMEDKRYWSECLKVIEQLPGRITVTYCGEVEHSQIPYIFEQYHAFFFPTLGENYGHVIVEAMMNNCLCILSKGVTPWDEYIHNTNLGAELNQRESFVQIIEELINMDSDQVKKLILNMQNYVKQNTDSEAEKRKYIELFKCVK